MKTPTNACREELVEMLTDPVEAGEYLGACLLESEQAFLLGLRDVVTARGGMARLSAATGLAREALYRTLSADGNPRLSSLRRILEALGLRVSFVAFGTTRGGRPHSRQPSD